jgi:hypothetical protein
MATCLVSGTLLTGAGEAATSVTVAARVPQATLIGNSMITPYEVSVATDTSGNFALTLQQSLQVIFTVTYPTVGTEPMRSQTFTATVPATTTASFSSIIVVE